MLTKRQEELLQADFAIDIEVIGKEIPLTGGVWQLFGFIDGKEYLWASTGCIAESIAMSKFTNCYYAAPDQRFKAYNARLVCIWYR